MSKCLHNTGTTVAIELTASRALTTTGTTTGITTVASFLISNFLKKKKKMNELRIGERGGGDIQKKKTYKHPWASYRSSWAVQPSPPAWVRVRGEPHHPR
jgi:hypothetical protein